jgi:hypothetical protein
MFSSHSFTLKLRERNSATEDLTMPEEFLLKPSEAASRMKIAPQTAATWRYKGIGPAFIVLNGAIRYRPSEIEKFLDSQTIQPGEDRPEVKRRRGGTGRPPWKNKTRRGSR